MPIQGKSYGGVSDKAREIKNIYVGVNNVARKVVRAYVGDDNGKAREIYNERLYLFRNGTDNTAVTGGWTRTLQRQTNGGANYTMTKLTNNGSYLTGSVSGTGTHRCLQLCSTNAVSLTGYTKLIFKYTLMHTGDTVYERGGLFNPSYSNYNNDNLASRLLAWTSNTISTSSSSYVSYTKTVDVSSVTKNGYIFWDLAKNSTTNASVTIRISEIYLEP